MSTSVTSLTLDGLDKLSSHARRCVFWETDPAAVRAARETGNFYDPEFEKEAWLSMVMLQWGSCGQVAMVDDKPAGCALYAPPSMVPRADLFPTSPSALTRCCSPRCGSNRSATSTVSVRR